MRRKDYSTRFRVRYEGGITKVCVPFLLVFAFVIDLRADVLDWLNQEFLQKIQITGTQKLGLHLYDIQGDEEQFNQQFFRGRNNKITDERLLNIRANNLFGFLNVDAQINNSPFALPLEQKMTLNVEKGWFKADAGDINASLSGGNELVRFNRTMRGLQLRADRGNLSAQAIYSESKAAPRTVTLQGNNSPGPYYLGAGLIVEGSVYVQVDGDEQELGEDYTLNSYIGTITFMKSIPPSSTIVVTFETLTINQSRSDVMGGLISYQVLPGVKIGYTRMEQKPKANFGLAQITEEFYGYGPPDMPYYLSMIPAKEFPIIVTVDGVLQTEGVDYYFDENNPQIFYMTYYVPNTSIIRVTYTPKPDPGTFGNGRRIVHGWDIGWTIGKSGKLSFSTAESSLYSPLGVQHGRAQAANFQYTWGRFEFGARWRNIPSTFVSVESSGFMRNEKGGDIRMRYNAGKGWKFGVQAADLSISTPTYGEDGFSTIHGKTQSLKLTADYQQGTDKTAFANYDYFKGSYAGIANSGQKLTAGYKQTFKKWTLESTLTQQHTTTTKVTDSGTEPVDADIFGTRIAASYRASDQFNLVSSFGLNDIKSEGKNSTGYDVNLRGEYRFSDRLSMDLTLADTYSGLIAGLSGYMGGYGYGYNGNGFSGGSYDLTYNNATSRAKLAQFHAQWQPTDNLSIEPLLAYTLSEGDNLSNSRSFTASLNASWTPNNKTSLYTRFDHTKVEFVGGSGPSHSTIANFALDHRFTKRLRLTADYAFSVSGGIGLSGFNQRFNTLFANLSYNLAPRQRLFTEFRNGNVIGYLADRENYLGVGYAYDILPGIALRAIYRWRERLNLGSESEEGSYRSSGFDIELEINFKDNAPFWSKKKPKL